MFHEHPSQPSERARVAPAGIFGLVLGDRGFGWPGYRLVQCDETFPRIIDTIHDGVPLDDLRVGISSALAEGVHHSCLRTFIDTAFRLVALCSRRALPHLLHFAF